MNGTQPSCSPSSPATPSRRAFYSGCMAKRSPAQEQARAALAEAADAAKTAKKAAKRLDDKAARRLRRLAAEIEELAAGRDEAARNPERVRRAAQDAASRLRLATDTAVRQHAVKQQQRAAATQERVRAAMTASVPVVETVPAARTRGVPVVVRPEAARRR